MAELTLSKHTLVRLLERASPDPCEPYGCDPSEPPNEPPEPPIWEFPRSAAVDVFGRLQRVQLNPQPLPPKGHWRPAMVARITIARALATHESAEALSDDQGAQALGLIQRNVSELVDDWCGTGPHPRPFPWPWGPILRGSEDLQPIELIVAGAQFLKAADALKGNALQETFEGAADRFLETGLARLAEAD